MRSTQEHGFPDTAVTTASVSAAALHRAAAACSAERIRAVILDGQRYWIKRRETLPLRWRLQKGNPARRFARERAVLHDLMARGAPVPPIVAEGEDWFALPDCGTSLEAIFNAAAPGEQTRAFAAAGTALAQLHGIGLAHGRPHPRDLCWDGRQIRFLDFERGRAGPAAPWQQALDVIQLVFALYAMKLDGSPALEAFCAAYRRADRRALWLRAQRLCHRLRWLDWMTRPIQRHERFHKPDRHYKEWQALPRTLARFSITVAN